MTLRITLFILSVSVIAAFGLFMQARADEQIGLLSLQPQNCTLRVVANDARVRLSVKCPGLEEFGIVDIDRKLAHSGFTALEVDMSPPPSETKDKK